MALSMEHAHTTSGPVDYIKRSLVIFLFARSRPRDKNSTEPPSQDMFIYEEK